jgi:hypothetical protein
VTAVRFEGGSLDGQTRDVAIVTREYVAAVFKNTATAEDFSLIDVSRIHEPRPAPHTKEVYRLHRLQGEHVYILQETVTP